MNSYRTIVFAGLFASWLLFSPAPALAQAVAASPDGTTVPPASSIVDSRGNVWTLTANGQIARNGRIDRITNSVLLLVYSDGAVYQKTSWIGNDGQNLWWRWSRGRWIQTPDPLPPPPPPPIDGQCGPAEGVAVDVAPTSNLCSAGTASA